MKTADHKLFAADRLLKRVAGAEVDVGFIRRCGRIAINIAVGKDQSHVAIQSTHLHHQIAEMVSAHLAVAQQIMHIRSHGKQQLAGALNDLLRTARDQTGNQLQTLFLHHLGRIALHQAGVNRNTQNGQCRNYNQQENAKAGAEIFQN